MPRSGLAEFRGLPRPKSLGPPVSLAALAGTGSVVADYAWDRPAHDDLRANGIAGVMRYAAYPGHQGKGMDRDEYEALLAAGFAVGWILETFGQAASRGSDQGVREAQMAFAWADGIGWPRSRPGYFCAEDPSPIGQASWGAVADYFRGVHDADPGRPRPGAYGSGALCQYLADAGLISLRWHVSTWPGGDRAASALTQEANGIEGHTTWGGAIDLNSVHAEDWGQVPAPGGIRRRSFWWLGWDRAA